MNNIEVERRSFLSEEKYKELITILEQNAVSLGQDDKNVVFYVFKDKLIKVVDEKSKGKAKIVYKSDHICNSNSLEEIEIPISPNDFEKANLLISKILTADTVLHSFQQRHNYSYKGTEIALKYSDTWGHHVEIEVMVNNADKAEEAEKKITSVAADLGLKLLSNKELAEFSQKAESGYKRMGNKKSGQA